MSALEFEYELSDYDLGEDVAALVFETADGNGSTVTVVPASDQGSMSNSLSGSVCECLIADGTVYILADDGVNAFDPGGNLLATAPLGTAYRSMAVVGDEIFLLGYRSVEKIEFSV